MDLRARLERTLEGDGTQRRRSLVFHGSRVLLALALALFTFGLFRASPAVDFPIYEVGAVAADNVISPFSFRVPKSPEELARERDALVRSAEPIFTRSPAAADSARAALRAFARALDEAQRADPAGAVLAVQRAAALSDVTLDPAEAAYLVPERRRRALVDAVDRVFARWLAPGVASSGALDDVRGLLVLRDGADERRLPADSVLTFSMLVSRARLVHPDPGSTIGDALYLRMLGAFFRPTVTLDRTATQVRRQELAASVPTTKYEVRAGEKIIGANEVVGREEHEKLRALHTAVGRHQATERGVRRMLGAVLFNALIIGLLGFTLLLFRPAVYANPRWILMFAACTAVVLIGAALVAQSRPLHPELVPIALAVVLISALFDQRIAMIAAMVLAVLIGGQAVFRGTNALFINLVGGAVAAFSVRAVGRRNQSYLWILTIAAAYFVTAVAIGLALDLPWGEIVTSAAWGSLNALVSVLLALLLLPLAESVTGIVTDLTLLEWSDLNRAPMQRLSLEAPGTYAHTIAIANLAEAGARAIGANALLARVGAYYHDIGKLAKPQYFVENQSRGRNPHDKLKPGTSAQIIRNHVREGLEMAEQYRIPMAIRAFITEHHGTGPISFFLERAKEREGTVVNAAEYAYPGPLPQSAETAIVMLADGVEAATRVLGEPTAPRIREVVDHIVRQRIEQGQLRDAPLTLRQLDIVKEEFARVLSGMYHGRVEYPASAGGVNSEFAAT